MGSVLISSVLFGALPATTPCCPDEIGCRCWWFERFDSLKGHAKAVGIVYEQTHSRCFSDIEFSITMMEGVLVGCMAQRVGGKLAWNEKTQTFDRADANALIKPYIRRGFEF